MTTHERARTDPRIFARQGWLPARASGPRSTHRGTLRRWAGLAASSGRRGAVTAGRRWKRVALGVAILLAAALAVLEMVRGAAVVVPGTREAVERVIDRVVSSDGTIDSQQTIEIIGALAAGIAHEEGLRPGPFHVLYLPQLDWLEKIHHAVHGPFTDIRRMYCDIWINSLTTYGTLEETWGLHTVFVRPALQLPVLELLLDRLERQKTTLAEHLEAPFEATRGMDVHSLEGRARLWTRLMEASARHPRLVPWMARQLDRADPSWTDNALLQLWTPLTAEPTPARLEALAGQAAAERPSGPSMRRGPVPPARSWGDAYKRVEAAWAFRAIARAMGQASAGAPDTGGARARPRVDATPGRPGRPATPVTPVTPASALASAQPVASAGSGVTGSPEAPASPATPASSAASAHDPSMFEDITARAGISFVHSQSIGGRVIHLPESLGSGCAMVDYDGDGKLDLFFVQGSGPTDGKDPATIPTCKLYRNRGDGTFEDVTHRVGLDIRAWGMGCLWFDYDNDGRPDLFLTCYGGSNRLFHQEPDHTFKDVTAAAGLLDPKNVWSTGAAAIDFDRDGRLDLYVCGYLDFEAKHFIENPRLVTIYSSGVGQPSTLSPFAYSALPNRLYRNRGDGTFEDVTAKAGVADVVGKSLAAMAADLDGDGWTDLLVANDVTPKALYMNQHDGHLVDEASRAWIGDIRGSMGLACGDIDGDGALDVFCTHWVNESNGLYRNNLADVRARQGVSAAGRRLTFTEMAQAAGLTEPTQSYVGWGCALADLDNDGTLDEVHVNGHTFLDQGTPRRLIPQEAMVFLQSGLREFRRLHFPPGDPIEVPRVGRGLAVGDVDGDGWLDLLISQNNGPAALLRHVPGARESGHWLEVALEGTRSNRDAVGATVRVRCGALNLSRARASGESYLSCHSPVLHFGLGRHTRIDALDVRWPSGDDESFPAPSVDRLVRLREGTGTKEHDPATRPTR